MNPEDVSVIRAERDASPERFAQFDPEDSFGHHYGPLRDPSGAAEKQRESGDAPQDQTHPTPHEQAGQLHAISESGSTTTRESVEIEPLRGTGSALSREQTQTDRINAHLERHPTALSRIETHRSQHSSTVGPSATTVRSRKAKPLPKFGAGKPYPPPLPEREEYVVEFDGHDDPLHPNNWSLKKKYVVTSFV